MEVKYNKVDFSYNDSSDKILKSLDVEFHVGKINAIVGLSGSGKSTIIKMLNGLILPNIGEVNVDNFSIHSKEMSNSINELMFEVGIVFQDVENHFLQKTVFDELALYLNEFKYKQNHLKDHIEKAIMMVGLDESYLNREIKTLSSGEKRLIALASVLSINPKVLILDSIMTNLDINNQQIIINIINKLKRRYNKTIIIIDNNVEIIHKLADYIYILNDGMIKMEGTKYEVFTKHQELKKYGITVPKIINFENMVCEKKGIRLGYRDDVNDLLKDIYRNK